MKPICVPCQRFMRPKKNGYYFLEGMPNYEWDGKSGKESEGWIPYKLWVGDLFECPDCHAQTISGIPSRNKVAACLWGRLMVKDC